MEKLQLHYYLNNDIHYMDAIIKNRSEAELIKLIKHIGSSLGLEVDVECEALEEGGIKEFFRISFRKKNRKKIKLFIEKFGWILITVLTTHLVDNSFENNEDKLLEKEERKLRIEKLKLEIEQFNVDDDEFQIDPDSVIEILDNEGKTIILKSNFYSHLINEDRVYQISVQELTSENEPVGEEKFVKSNVFKKFIVKEVELEPSLIENVEVEIISPVFKKGNDNWKGIFNGEPIDFKIGDPLFKNKVLDKELSFTTGTKILCDLEIKRVLDKKGEPKIKSRYAYDITVK